MTPYQRQQESTRLRLALKPTKLKVGDHVRLNNHGLEQVYGTTRGVAKLCSFTHVITAVDTESLTYPEATFPVEVADEELNAFLIDDACFDKVETA